MKKEGREREREGRIDLGAGHEERSAAWGGGLPLIGDARALGGRDTSTRGLKVSYYSRSKEIMMISSMVLY